MTGDSRESMQEGSGRHPVPATARRRPKDRKQQILRIASELFRERGFHEVHLKDIATRSGVTPRALYRHYPNKQALLAAVIAANQEKYAILTSDPRRADALSDVLDRLVDDAIETSDLTILWQREARYLAEDDRAVVRSRLTRIVSGIRTALTTEVPALDPDAATLRAWSLSSVLTSIGRYPQKAQKVPRDQLHSVLACACRAVIAMPVSAESAAPANTERRDRPWTPGLARRDTILDAASRLFLTRGYPGIGVNDLGQESGIAGPGVYRYFPTKQAILDELLVRVNSWEALEFRRAAKSATTPEQFLACWLDGLIRLNFEEPDNTGLFLTELPHVTAAVAERVTADDAERLDGVVAALREISGRSQAEADILVRAVVSFVGDIARTPRVRRLPGARRQIHGIAMSVLRS